MICVKTKEKKATGDQYEIRRDGVCLCSSTIPRLGYSVKMLRGMLKDGYRYYVNGKMVRKIEE